MIPNWLFCPQHRLHSTIKREFSNTKLRRRNCFSRWNRLCLGLDWSHSSFINITTEISSAATAIISVNIESVKITPLNFDATPLNYNAMLTDRTGNNSLNSTFISTQDNLNGTRSLTQQDIRTLSRFVTEELVKTKPTTTQQSTSPIWPTITTPQNKNTSVPQTTIQSTVKPSVTPKYSQINYQTIRSPTTSRQANRQNTNKKPIFQIINTTFVQTVTWQNLILKAAKINHRHKTAINKYHNKFLTQFFSTINNELQPIVAKISHFFNI